MRVTIQGQPQEIKVTSIILEKDLQSPMVLKMMFCINCGSSVIRYSGRIVQIFPGETPVDIPVVAFCRKCKTQYLLTSIV